MDFISTFVQTEALGEQIDPSDMKPREILENGLKDLVAVIAEEKKEVMKAAVQQIRDEETKESEPFKPEPFKPDGISKF
ncbi:MAG: hypothetical protein QNK11_05200 [Legionella sp.]|nr:hypothetical protein [Legionella sp.]